MPDDARHELSHETDDSILSRRNILLGSSALVAAATLTSGALAQAQKAAPSPSATPASSGRKPNIVMIMADDVGTWNLSAYHRGMMGGCTPNIDRIAREGALFTDYYGQQSCTAGRAAFITGQTPFRTGTAEGRPARREAGLAGFRSDDRRTAQATRLRHGADRQEPSGRPQRIPAHGPRLRRVLRHPLSPQRDGRALRPGVSEGGRISRQGSAHATSSTAKPPTSMTRPRIRAGAGSASRRSPTPVRCRRIRAWMTAAKVNMEDIDAGSGEALLRLHRPLGEGGNAVFPVAQLHALPRLDASRPSSGTARAASAVRRCDDGAGLGRRARLLDKLDELGIADNTIVLFTSDNGAEIFSWPDGGNHPFRGEKGTVYEGGFRVPMVAQVARRHQAGHHRQRHHVGRRLDADTRCGRRRRSGFEGEAAHRLPGRRRRPSRTISTATTSSRSSRARSPKGRAASSSISATTPI